MQVLTLRLVTGCANTLSFKRIFVQNTSLRHQLLSDKNTPCGDGADMMLRCCIIVDQESTSGGDCARLLLSTGCVIYWYSCSTVTDTCESEIGLKISWRMDRPQEGKPKEGNALEHNW